MKKLVSTLFALCILSFNVKAQCLQIESILVDACVNGGTCSGPADSCACEGINEMVLIKIGSSPLTVSYGLTGASAGLVPNWPANSFKGWAYNANTHNHTARLNASITTCGYLKEPVGGVLPANAQVLIFTSENVCVTANSFASLQDTLYVLFQTQGNSGGHYANQNNGGTISSTPTGAFVNRTTTFTYAALSCTVSATYHPSYLINNMGTYGGSPSQNDGATVDFDAMGNATYVNNGCKAPFIPVQSSASVPSSSASACNTAPVTSINGVVSGPAISYNWTTSGTGTITPASGTLTPNVTTTLNPVYNPGSNETGNVTFTLTVHGKCPTDITVSTTSVYLNGIPTPTITSTNGHDICNGGSTVLSASSSGTLTTTYNWNPAFSLSASSGSPVTANPPTGNYDYTVTATNACGSANTDYSLTVNPLPAISVSNSTICIGQISTLTASGADTYTWASGAQGTTYTASPGSTTPYSVTGTNTLTGCQSIGTGTITVNSLPVISVSNASVCPGNTGTLTASGADTYTWTGGVMGNTYTATPSNTTTYTLAGTNTVTGCENTASGTITIYTVTAISVNSPTTCPGQPATLVASPSTLQSYTWTGTGIVSTTYSATVVQALTGTYTYNVSGTTTEGCVLNTATSTLTVNGSSQITIVTTNTLPCIGSTNTLTANGATTYTWNPSAALTLSGIGSNIATYVVPSTPVTYSVSGGGICPSTPTVITINPAPVSTISIVASPTNAAVCPGNTITFTASVSNRPGTYTFNPSVNNGTAFTPTVSQTYTVNATDANGCSATTNTIAVTVYPNPAVNITPSSTTICMGDGATLTANGTPALQSYTWSPAGSLNSISAGSVAATPTITTSYTVNVTDANGCAGTATATITVNPTSTIVISGSVTATCVGSPVGLSIAAPGSYTWSTFNGTVNPSTGQNTVFTPSFAGTATITAIGSQGGCSANPATFTLNVNSLPSFSVSVSPNDTICKGGTVSLTGSPSTYTYSWSGGITNGQAFSLSNAGNYTYSVTAADANQCQSQNTQMITVLNNPVVNFTFSPVAPCAGQTATLTASGAGITGNYTWASSNGTPVSPNTGNPAVTSPSVATTYTLIGEDSHGCLDSIAKTINISPLPVSQAIGGNTFVCVYGTDILSVAPVAGYNYYWTGPAPSSATVSAGSSATIHKGGIYTLHAQNNCGDAPTTYTVTTDSVRANFTFNPSGGQSPLLVNLDASTSYGNNLAYGWNFGDGGLSAQIITTHIYNGAGNYHLQLTVTDGRCVDSAATTIIVSDLPSVIIIPNVFTPNADGINDVFSIKMTGYTDLNCEIYDRWGISLYSWSGVNGGWDGKAKNGASCTDGTYFYVLTYSDAKGIQQKKQGYFQLIR